MNNKDEMREESLAELMELRRRVAQLEQSRLELQRVKKELRNSQQHLEAIFHAALDPVCLLDRQGTILALNDKTAERLGRKREELLGQSLLDFLPPDLAKKRRKTLDTIFETGLPFKTESESFPGRFSLNSGHPIFGEDGNVETVAVFSRDVTEERQAREALSESEQRYRLLTENSLTGIFMYQDGAIVYVNKRGAEIVGYEREDILGKSGWDFLHPEDIELVEKRLAARAGSEDIVPQYRVRIVTKDGKTKWLEVIAVQIQWQGRSTILGNVVDITDRKEAEERIKESEEKLRAIIEHSTNVFYSHGTDHVLTYVSPQIKEFLGVEPEEALVKWTHLITDNPVNLEGMKLTQRAIDTAERQPSYELELIGEDGLKLWAEVNESPVVVNGRTVAIVGSLTDVTERKRARDALRESEERYRQLVDLSPDGILVSVEGRYVFANNAMARMLGASGPEQLVGKQVLDFIHPKYHAAVNERRRILAGQREPVPLLEEEYVRLDGSVVEVEVVAAPIEYNQQHANQIVVRDISKRKRVDQALRKTEQLLGNILRASPIGISYVEEGKLKWINRAMFEMFRGREQGEWQDKSLKEYYASDEEYRRVQALFFEKLKQGVPAEGEALFKRIDGSVFHGYFKAVALDASNPSQGSITTISDISAQKRAELEREFEKQKFRIMAENAPLGIAVIDSEGTFQYLNPRFIGLFGYGPEDLPNGREWFRRAYPDPAYRHEVISAWLSDFSGPEPQEPASRIFNVRCKDGVQKIVHFRSVKLPTGPYLMTCEDITDLKRAEYLVGQQRDLCRGLSSVSDLDHALRLCIETALRVSHLDAAGIYVVNDDGSLTLVAHEGVTDEFVAAVSRLESDTPAARLMQKGKPFYPKHARTVHVEEALQRERVRAAAVIPIEHEARVVACLIVASHTLEEIPWRDRDALETVAGQLGSAIARLKAEEGRRESERMLRGILATSPVGIGLSQGRKMKWVNRAWMEMFGFKNEDECLNIDTRMLYPAEGEYERVGVLYRNLRDGILAGIDAKMKRKDGSVFDAHIRMNDLDPNDHAKGTMAAISDISQRKQMEEALRQSEATLKSVLEAAPIGIGMVSSDQKFLWVNESLANVSGYSQDELTGQSVRMLYESDEEFFRVGRVAHEQVKERGTVSIETRGKKKDGGSADLLIHLASVVPGDPSARVVLTAMDITDQKRTEEIMLQSERLQAVADLASGVAHNFNNILQIIVGSADLAVLDLELGDLRNVNRGLKQILETSRFGAETVKRLQSFAHIRAEVQPEESHVFDLSEVVKQASEISMPWWKTKSEKEGVKISLDLDLVKGCFIRGKESELFEVLVNLIKNAVEAMPQGGHVTVKTALRDDQVALTVWDTGIGIPKQELKKIFDPFWSTKGVKGTGMGLAITYGIISRHSGTIAADSTEGAGTTFKIHLPFIKEGPDPRTLETRSFDFQLSILAIDDMVPIVMMLDQLLTKHGQKVFKAVSGQEAIKIFKEENIDVVICDLGMPGMNGWDIGKAIRAICQERGIPKTPFVLLTGWGGQSFEEEKIKESGVDAVMEKPLDIPKLLDVIREVVSRNAA